MTASAAGGMRLVVATHNRDKFREIAGLLAGLPLDLTALFDHAGAPETEETGATLAENALLKARAAAAALGVAAVADDSGLEVAALDGAPGVRSSRFAGENVSYADNNRLLIERLRGVPPERRQARFMCVAALVEPGAAGEPGRETVVEGEVRGIIAEAARGTHGFGYDPLFVVADSGRTMAELPLAEKQRISHRGQAFRRMREVIASRVAGDARAAPAAPR